MEQKRLSTTAVGALLGYSHDKVRLMCEQGKFPNATRDGVGGHWRVPESDVEAFKQASRPKVVRRTRAA